MDFTGERPVYNTSSQLRSIALYKTAFKYIRGKRVMDYGCGVGCGINILKEHAEWVIGYDHCEEAIREARLKYPECKFYSEFSWDDLDINSIVCLEVIEHMEKEEVIELLYKIKEKNIDGYFSTPNGNIFPYHPRALQERRGFHVWHYTYDELKDLFSIFKHYDIFGLEWDPAFLKGSFVTYGVYCSNR